MDSPGIKLTGQAEVPAQIFEEFLNRLEKSEVSADVLSRLRTSIIDEKDLAEKALKEALFSDEESND